MFKRSLFFISLIFLSLSQSEPIIKDLYYNIRYEENMKQYENGLLPSGTHYYIRFPSNFKDKLNFSISIPLDILIFPIYLLKFSTYPNNSQIINYEQEKESEEIHPENIENSEYNTYSYIINNDGDYIVLHFTTEDYLDYLRFYANIDFRVLDIPCNQNYYLQNIKKGNRIYIRIDYTKYSGEKFEIKLSYKPKDLDQGIEFDMRGFEKYPQNNDVYIMNNNWDKNLKGVKDSNEENLSTGTKENYNINYEKNTNKDVKYIAIQIDPKCDLINLEFYLDVSKIFPSWAITLIVIGAIIIFVIIYFIIAIISPKGGEACCICFQYVCCICAILGRKH